MVVKTYLAGSIQHSQSRGKGWRNMLKQKDWEGIEFVDPLDKYDGPETDETDEWSDERIVREDKELIDECDAILLHHEKVPSWGTPREHEYAVQTGTPVYVQTRESNLSPWLTTDAEVVTRAFGGAFDAIQRDLVDATEVEV